MGCPPRFNPDRGKMVEKKRLVPSRINFSGTKSNIPSVSGSCSISQGAPHLFWQRQLHGNISYKQAGGHSVSNTVKSSKRSMELCPERKPDNFSHSPSREAECLGKSQVKYFKAFHRMDAH